MTRRTARQLMLLTLLSAAPLGAQQPGAPAPAAAPARPVRPELAIGQPAPDFSLAGATRYGLLQERIRLSQLRGKTVVLAFFYAARTKG